MPVKTGLKEYTKEADSAVPSGFGSPAYCPEIRSLSIDHHYIVI